ncbi:adenosine deaminase [Anaerosporomusa subterranea]|uniref:Adenine deaminase n=1 Tax=Anaerosporomusa subterranea TaxID=1794912 RepID=A0A154BVR2_ANASB|nr:adenine deaminase C-terminal domain-containing protein [Anaerosporomusa subterranea]KYZ78076.1 adenosine deaminase [Anaerosporomusa subterranea]
MKVDLLLKNVRIFNSYAKRFIDADAAILNGKFLYIGKRDIDQLQPDVSIDGQGAYMIPGLIDIHMHIESSMTAPLPFSWELVKNGVTTIVAEPHEIANIFGIEGIRSMLEAGKDAPNDIFLGVPSSVPSTSLEIETSGATIELADLAELLQSESVVCLGEVMNYVDVVYKQDAKINQLINYTRTEKPHLPIEGHCPKLLGLELARFIYAGVDSDHTQQTVAGMEERLLNGMFVEIQEKSLTPDIINFLIEQQMGEHFAFVTDDVMADSLVAKGHLNHIVKSAIGLGMKPEQAIYAATFTPARRMGLKDRGSIAPGKRADFVLLDNLEQFTIAKTFKNGKEVFNQSEHQKSYAKAGLFPKHFYHSVKLSPLNEGSFRLPIAATTQTACCRIITVTAGTTFTKETQAELPVRNAEIDWENSAYCLIGVFERHGKNGNIGWGLVGGDVISQGAIATTYAHDHHNLLVIGRNKRDMLIAANTVIANQGGYCVVHDGEVIGEVALPVAGILSELPISELAQQVKGLKEAMQKLGFKHGNPIMSLSTLSLPVSQELKITDKGLVKVNEQKLVSLLL